MSDDTTATQTGTSADTAPQAGEAAPSSTTTDHPRAFSQEDLNRILAANKREWEKQAKRAADDAKAAAQGEFQTLAEQRAARIAELEQQATTAAAIVERYQAEVQAEVDARVKQLPQELRALQPDGDPLVVYAWLKKAEAAASKLTAATAAHATPPGPAGTGGGPFVTATPADVIARKRASGIY